jgi:hypothetical protein
MKGRDGKSYRKAPFFLLNKFDEYGEYGASSQVT